MKTMKRSVNAKTRGFSLAETLLTVLIISLAGIALSGGISLLQHSYKEITQKADAETLLSTTIYEISNHLRYADNITQTNTSLYFTNVSSGYKTSLSNSDDSKGIVVNYYLGNGKPESYQLLSDKTMANGLQPRIKDLTWENNMFTFTIQILNHNEKVICSQYVKIRPLNS